MSIKGLPPLRAKVLCCEKVWGGVVSTFAGGQVLGEDPGNLSPPR